MVILCFYLFSRFYSFLRWCHVTDFSFLTVLHTSFLPSFPLSLSLFFFPCIHPSLDPLLRHTLPTNVRYTGQNPEALPPGAPVRREIREKAHCGDFLEASSLTVFTKEPFGVCVSEAGAHFSKEESIFGPAVLRWLLPGTLQDHHGPPSLSFFPARGYTLSRKAPVLALEWWPWEGHELFWAFSFGVGARRTLNKVANQKPAWNGWGNSGLLPSEEIKMNKKAVKVEHLRDRGPRA